MIRFGDGTEESHRARRPRWMTLWTYTGELFAHG